MDTLITYLQIFGIGFSFGLAGPCFLTCTPVLITYVTGSKKNAPEAFKDIVIFLSGRLFAYILLGALAGLSGAVLKKFTDSSLTSHLQMLAGAMTILFAVILATAKSAASCDCSTSRGRILNFGGVFVFGFLIGVSPCAPLLALLFDITIMSKGLLDGAFYALFFGLGTFLSGLIAIGLITGLLTRIPATFIRSKIAIGIFRFACALLLLAMGIELILRSYSH